MHIGQAVVGAAVPHFSIRSLIRLPVPHRLRALDGDVEEDADCDDNTTPQRRRRHLSTERIRLAPKSSTKMKIFTVKPELFSGRDATLQHSRCLLNCLLEFVTLR